MHPEPDDDRGGLADLNITDTKDAARELKDVSIAYPSTYGPSDEKKGIRVRQGTIEALLEWSNVEKLTFKPIKERKADGKGFAWRYEVNALLRSGKTQQVELVEDWNMSAGQTGLLFGKTDLGETKIRFSDIRTIVVLKF